MSLENDLRDHPETIRVEFAGRERPFLLTPFGARKAKEEMGVDFIERLADIALDIGSAYTNLQEEYAEDGEEEVEVPWEDLLERISISTDDLTALSAGIYAGFLPFNDEIDPRDVEMRLTVGTLQTLLPTVGDQLFGFLMEETPENGQIQDEEVDVEAGKSPSHVSNESATPQG